MSLGEDEDVCLFSFPQVVGFKSLFPKTTRRQAQERKERDGVESKLWSCLCGRQQLLVLDQVWRTFADR